MNLNAVLVSDQTVDDIIVIVNRLDVGQVLVVLFVPDLISVLGDRFRGIGRESEGWFIHCSNDIGTVGTAQA